MTTFLEDEESAESSAPREGIEFILPVVTYRVSTGTRNVVIDGRTFTAAPGGRGEVAVSSNGDPRSMTVTLPMSHAVCQRYMAGGVPPRQILVNIWRQQGVSGLTELVWTGHITSLAPEGNVGKLLVPSRSSEAYQRRLPTVTAGRDCPHILYDDQCQANRVAHQITTTVTSVSGRVIHVASIGNPDNWADFGEVEHVDSGERMTVQLQVGLVITMQLPIFELRFGDTVVVSAGCTHAIGVCASKFLNQVNFGGQPSLPFKNPHIPTGFGVYQSE